MSTGNSKDPMREHDELNQTLARLMSRRSAVGEKIEELRQKANALASARPRPSIQELLDESAELSGLKDLRQEIAEEERTARHIDEAMRDLRERLIQVERAASVHLVKGPDGDKWRRAVKDLHKLAKELVAVSQRVELEHAALRDKLPDPDALFSINFPALSSEDMPPSARLSAFELRLSELDRRYS